MPHLKTNVVSYLIASTMPERGARPEARPPTFPLVEWWCLTRLSGRRWSSVDDCRLRRNQIKARRAAGSRGQAGAAASEPSASARFPARKTPSPRGGGAAGAAALMAGTEQVLKQMNMTDGTSDPGSHSHLVGRTNRPALAVFYSNFRSGRILGAKPFDQVDRPAVHSESSRFRVKPSCGRRTRIWASSRRVYAGPVFALR
jgi:hypothetical protein